MLDCIIVGAGPGGGAAAYHLAKRGHSVLVLDKESLPRYKPCGGGVSPEIQELLDFDFTPVITAQVSKVGFTWKLGDPVEVELDSQPMWMVQRDVFDNFLLEKAKEKGAEVQDGTAVTALQWTGSAWQVKTTGETFESRYLIAADGAQGPCSQLLGFPEKSPHLSAILEIDSPPNNPDTAQFDFGSLKNGFIWSFPKSDRVAISGAILGSTKGKAKELQKQLTHYAQQLGFSPDKGQYYEFPMTLWSEDRTLHAQNALLVGDAAGVADPLLAEGIRPAIFMGMTAAEAISAHIGGDANALINYDQIVYDEWGSDMVWAQRLAGLFFKFPGVAYRVGVKQPRAAQLMSKILCGELRYKYVAEGAIKSLKRKFIPGQG